VFTAARPRGLKWRTNHDESTERRGPGVRHRQQLPVALDALEPVNSPVLQGDAGPGHQIVHGPGDQDFSGCCGGHDAGGDVHPDAAHVAVAQLDSAGVQPRPDFDSQPTQVLGECDRAADRPYRAVEGGQDPVAGALDQPPAEGLDPACTTSATSPKARWKRKRRRSAADPRRRGRGTVRAGGRVQPEGLVSAMRRPGWGPRRSRAGSAGSLGLLTAAPPIPLGRVQVASKATTGPLGLGAHLERRPRVPAVATPPPPNGSSRDRRGWLRRSAGVGTVSYNMFRSSPRSGSAVGSGRRDGQGDARAAYQLGRSGVLDEG
jgi:hypothetical protein